MKLREGSIEKPATRERAIRASICGGGRGEREQCEGEGESEQDKDEGGRGGRRERREGEVVSYMGMVKQ